VTGQLDTVRFGVLGCGYWGPNHIRNLTALRARGAVMAAAADPDDARRRHIADLYPGVRLVADADELIEAADIDALVIATPVGLHFDQARRALENGKHVLVEKPFTTSLAQARKLADVAAAHQRVLMVGHTYQYAGAVNDIRRRVRSGELGELSYIRSLRVNLGLLRTDANVIWDLAPHDVSIIDYVLGGVLPTQVSAVGAAHAGSRRENIAYLTMQYGSSIIGHVHVNWLAPAKIRRTIVGGSKQMIVYDDMQPSEKLLIYDKGVTIAPGDDPEKVYGELVSYRSGDVLAPRLDDREALSVEVDEVIRCILHGGTPTSDGAAGLRTVRVLEAAARSARDGSHFVDLDSADRGVMTPLHIVSEAETRTASAT
jgi:predicted dehydrogenase